VTRGWELVKRRRGGRGEKRKEVEGRTKRRSRIKQRRDWKL
jgi:hypothetical protein